MPHRQCRRRSSRPPRCRRTRNQRRPARHFVSVESDHAAVDFDVGVALHDHAIPVSGHRARARIPNAGHGLAHHAGFFRSRQDLTAVAGQVAYSNHATHRMSFNASRGNMGQSQRR
uniref:Uncharacterized protein n=1 Tax=Ralstonia solanacearum TaxID=305 RepID=A0A0S4WBN5_RALSL|nr:conserved protein of unknown function [Ralstonia solanacearum]